jgi:hypothetical protein
MLIVLAVVAILVVGVVLFMKREHYETTCPTGFKRSIGVNCGSNGFINSQACVLSGEQFPSCPPGQEYVDNVCRSKLDDNFSPPPGWSINITRTGIVPNKN